MACSYRAVMVRCRGSPDLWRRAMPCCVASGEAGGASYPVSPLAKSAPHPPWPAIPAHPLCAACGSHPTFCVWVIWRFLSPHSGANGDAGCAYSGQRGCCKVGNHLNLCAFVQNLPGAGAVCRWTVASELLNAKSDFRNHVSQSAAIISLKWNIPCQVAATHGSPSRGVQRGESVGSGAAFISKIERVHMGVADGCGGMAGWMICSSA